MLKRYSISNKKEFREIFAYEFFLIKKKKNHNYILLYSLYRNINIFLFNLDHFFVSKSSHRVNTKFSFPENSYIYPVTRLASNPESLLSQSRENIRNPCFSISWPKHAARNHCGTTTTTTAAAP